MESNDLIKEGLRRINRTMVIFSRNFYYPGYTFNELNVLGTIVRHPGMIARDICEYDVIDRGYLSKILKKLEKTGLILRTAGKRTPFEKVLSVTELGEKVYFETEQQIDHSIMDRLSGMSDSDKASFYGCVKELVRYMDLIGPDTMHTAAEAERGSE